MLLRFSRLFLIVELVVGFLLSQADAPSAQAALAGSGSVTARVFICPDGLSLTAVLGSSDPSVPLAGCDPSAGAIIAPRLRATSAVAPMSGDIFAEGVYLWAGLPFGSYDFSNSGAPLGFEDRLITNGNSVAVTDQERGMVTIRAALPDIERRFYYFAPPDLPVGAISLTLYRCPDADTLGPADCMVLVDPPSDHASLFPDLWTDPLRGNYKAGRAVWHGFPFGIYSIIHSGILKPGEGAAIPELACISPDRCAMLIGPEAPSASLELYVFPIPAGVRDSDGDGYTDPHELAGGTDPNDPLSPGPDRSHSRVDTDADHLSDQDEAFYRSDPNNPDTDGDRVADGEEIASGTNAAAVPPSGDVGSDRDGDGPSKDKQTVLGSDPHSADSEGN